MNEPPPPRNAPPPSSPAPGRSRRVSPGSAAGIVPAYFGPWANEEWELLVRLRPAIVVINPANGPGRAPHGGYRENVDRCRAFGADVLGYVATGWLRRPIDEVADDVTNYGSWYGTSGAFFDEIPNGSARGRLATLARLNALTGRQRTVFNCGQPIPLRWYRVFPEVLWGTFEGAPAQLLETSFLGPALRQIHLVHSVPSSATSTVVAELARRGVGFSCVTTDEMPNPWDVCPPGDVAE